MCNSHAHQKATTTTQSPANNAHVNSNSKKTCKRNYLNLNYKNKTKITTKLLVNLNVHLMKKKNWREIYIQIYKINESIKHKYIIQNNNINKIANNKYNDLITVFEYMNALSNERTQQILRKKYCE